MFVYVKKIEINGSQKCPALGKNGFGRLVKTYNYADIIFNFAMDL
jgi:hypothetical protein